jgi:hypothetical protein
LESRNLYTAVVVEGEQVYLTEGLARFIALFQAKIMEIRHDKCQIIFMYIKLSDMLTLGCPGMAGCMPGSSVALCQELILEGFKGLRCILKGSESQNRTCE